MKIVYRNINKEGQVSYSITDKIKTSLYAYKVGEIDEEETILRIENILTHNECECEFKQFCVQFIAYKKCSVTCLEKMKENNIVKLK